jgi:hypothetical protein
MIKKSIITVFLGIGIGIIFLSTLNIYSQQNITNTNTNINNTIAEDFKDCFLDLKTKGALSSSMADNKYIMMLCYETYKGEGVFNHQLSEDQIVNMNQKIFELRKSSDLDKILKAFEY